MQSSPLPSIIAVSHPGHGAIPPPPRLLLTGLYLAGAILLAAAAPVDRRLWPALLLVPLGLVSGPRDPLGQFVLSGAAPPGTRTEAFAWSRTLTRIEGGSETGTVDQGPTLRRLCAASVEGEVDPVGRRVFQQEDTSVDDLPHGG